MDKKQLEVTAAIVASGLMAPHGGSSPGIIADRAVSVALAIHMKVKELALTPEEED
jgi:hypothetical protein